MTTVPKDHNSHPFITPLIPQVNDEVTPNPQTQFVISDHEQLKRNLSALNSQMQSVITENEQLKNRLAVLDEKYNSNLRSLADLVESLKKKIDRLKERNSNLESKVNLLLVEKAPLQTNNPTFKAPNAMCTCSSSDHAGRENPAMAAGNYSHTQDTAYQALYTKPGYVSPVPSRRTATTVENYSLPIHGQVLPSHHSASSQHVQLANEHMLAKEYDDGLLHIQIAIQLDNQNANAYAVRSEIYRFSGKTSESLAAAESALKIRKGNIMALVNKGIALSYFNRRQEALEIYATVLSLEPVNQFALEGTLENQFILADFDACHSTIDFTLQYYPDSQIAHNILRRFAPKDQSETGQTSNAFF